MNNTVRISDRLVGEHQPVFVIAEIGINHNGSVEIAKKLIDAASLAGFDEYRVLRQETVPRVDSLGSTYPGDVKNLFHIQVAVSRPRVAQRVSLVGMLYEQSTGISIGINGDGAYAQLLALPYRPEGNLSAVGD